jgi:hypothetical protein
MMAPLLRSVPRNTRWPDGIIRRTSDWIYPAMNPLTWPVTAVSYRVDLADRASLDKVRTQLLRWIIPPTPWFPLLSGSRIEVRARQAS